MVQRSVEQKFKDIGQYAEALKAFKEPDVVIKTPKNFTIHTDPLIEEYFKFVAQNGRTELEWDKIRNAFLWKLKAVIKDMKDKSLTKENEDKEKIERMSEFICARAEIFDGAPFTIQRICELLISPNRHYNSLGSFLRALEKTVNVISCVRPDGERIINTDEIDLENEIDDEEEDNIHVENTFMVRVDELEMDKPFPNERSPSKSPTKTSVHIAPPDSPHFLSQEVLESKSNVDLSDVVTYALPIGPHIPSPKKKESEDDDKMEQ